MLADRGYLYDASTLPTYLGPLARAYFLATARLTPEERRERGQLFGSFADGLRPAGAYQWQLAGGRSLLEIPVTTIPVIKTPFHMSYLIYLSRFSRPLMRSYLRARALALCRRAGVEPSFLLHPLDVLGPEQAPQLAFFPGMDVPGSVEARAGPGGASDAGRAIHAVTMSAHAARPWARSAWRCASRRPARPPPASG